MIAIAISGENLLDTETMRSKRKGWFHSPKRTFAETAEFPQWILVGGVLLVGFLLLIGALSDASGKLSKPGLGSVLYMAALIGVAAVLLYSKRHRRSSIKTDRNSRAVPNRLPPTQLRSFLGRCLGAISGAWERFTEGQKPSRFLHG